MEFIKTAIDGVWILEPRVFADARGYFMETWREEDFNRGVGREVRFVQDNESKSHRGVLRGLHYQRGDASQAKLVRVLQGAVVDVAVDLRQGSPTFGQHVLVELSADNKRQLFIPRGFAHGFQVLSDVAVFTYKVDNRYAPEAECSIRYDDPTIGIDWPLKEGVELSEKDLRHAVSFAEAEKFVFEEV
ncbi:MAG: dTDP-4-dehydrorhamnose 3,5-epimerase [Bacteroidaceae bacterium]|nr:dTDP-4-dehydrorhamnose 3,5-epimerase [Bacteroidaceae bacterium]